jgi:hypothetical protein
MPLLLLEHHENELERHLLQVLHRADSAGLVAPRDRGECPTMEGAGQRNGGLRMKAAVYTTYGPPDVVQIKDVEKPSPKENEVLIKVHAASVNAPIF